MNWFGKKKAIELDNNVELLLEDEVEEDDEAEEEEFEDEETIYDDLMQLTAEWCEEWKQTPAYQALSERVQSDADFSVEVFASYMYRYHDCEPSDWNWDDAKWCCVHTLPTKISAEEEFFVSLPVVLTSYLKFVGQRGYVPAATSISQRLMGLSREILKASNDPRNWGFAKAFVMQAKSEGIDLQDQAAMDQYMLQQNLALMKQSFGSDPLDIPQEMQSMDSLNEQPVTFVHEQPKVGRNDPCPCGSGKKYKKCCG